MSVSHPLIKELKGHILDLRKCSEVSEIRDHHPSLQPLCQALESILREGLKATCSSAFGLTKKDYWFWIEQLHEQKEKYNLPISICDAIESAKDCKKVSNSVGRGRLFIRTTLSKKLLQTVVSAFLQDESGLFSVYDPESSILGNDILAEIFTSLLHEINKIDFRLELKNASFLDETWALGVYKKYEFVPCKEMGITFGYVKGRAIVVKVEEGSVAAEDDQVEVGDVLDELYGRSLYRCRKGLIPSLAHQFQGLPVYLSVIKCMYINGGIYPPLLWLLDRLNLREQLEEKFQLHEDQDKKNGRSPVYSKFPISTDAKESDSCASSQFELLLLGKLYVGKEGRVTQIENAITKVVQQHKEVKDIVLDISETRIKIIDVKTEEILVSKHFTEVSACGRKTCCPEKFAFIAGEISPNAEFESMKLIAKKNKTFKSYTVEVPILLSSDTTCTIADEFYCYVFQSPSPEEHKDLEELIGQYKALHLQLQIT